MIQIDVANVATMPAFIRESLGKDAFNLMIGDFFDPSSFGPAPDHRRRGVAHPFALQWEKLLADIARSEESKTLSLCVDSLFLLDAVSRFLDFKSKNDPEAFLRKMTNGTQYFSATFEAYVHSAYQQAGYSILPIEETAGQRQADFEVSSLSAPVHIECKSLEDLTAREKRHWSEVNRRVAKALRNYKQSWRVRLEATRSICGGDVQPLVNEVIQYIRTGTRTSSQALKTAVNITHEVIAEWDVIQLGEAYPVRAEGAWLDGEFSWTPGGLQASKNIVIVESIPFFDPNHTRRILAAIDDAYGQIPDQVAGVVHVELPYRSGTRLLQVADQSYQRVFGYLRKKPRIAAVVVTGRSANPAWRPALNPIVDYHAVIPGPTPRVPIPPEFQLLGSQPLSMHVEVEDRGEPFEGDEGTILAEFEIFEPLAMQTGRDLFYYCASDGRHQLRLWQSFENHFRVDAVSPSYGRRTFRGDLNHLQVDAVHKCAASWSSAGCSVAIDGELLQALPE